jgi:hypothetical protein
VRRIWLGTFPTAEMAAVAARALRGPDAALNFPDLAAARPAPASASAEEICAAAAEAAASLVQPPGGAPSERGIAPAAAATAPQQHGGSNASAAAAAQPQGSSSAPNAFFLDEEALFETPLFLRNMAAGMMMSPPRISPNSSDDSPGPSEAGESLWSYDL